MSKQAYGSLISNQGYIIVMQQQTGHPGWQYFIVWGLMCAFFIVMGAAAMSHHNQHEIHPSLCEHVDGDDPGEARFATRIRPASPPAHPLMHIDHVVTLPMPLPPVIFKPPEAA